LGEGSHAQFEIEIGQRGPDAVNVKLLDDKWKRFLGRWNDDFKQYPLF
jgi:hypothetical protein